jgi:hypothetical protein
MDLSSQLHLVERVEGTRALFAYVIGLLVGAVVALPILAAFGVAVPVF